MQCSSVATCATIELHLEDDKLLNISLELDILPDLEFSAPFDLLYITLNLLYG